MGEGRSGRWMKVGSIDQEEIMPMDRRRVDGSKGKIRRRIEEGSMDREWASVDGVNGSKSGRLI